MLDILLEMWYVAFFCHFSMLILLVIFKMMKSDVASGQ